MKNIVALFLIVLATITVQASSKGKGGGDAVKDKLGKWRLLDLVESSESNYYVPQSEDYFKTVLTKLDTIKHLCSERYFAAPLNVIAGIRDYRNLNETNQYTSNDYYGYYGYEKPAAQVFEPLRWKTTKIELEEISDEGQVSYVDLGTKKQLAVQKDGMVLINETIFNSFIDEDKVALVLHEAVLNMLLVANREWYEINGTERVRQFVKIIMDEGSKKFPKGLLEKEFCGQSGVFNKNYYFRSEL